MRGSDVVAEIFENLLIMILAVAVFLVGGYLVLVVLGWAMKLKSGQREQDGLTDLLSQINGQQNIQNTSTDRQSDNND
jgi:nitrogen fixation-related uncharacterized protein